MALPGTLSSPVLLATVLSFLLSFISPAFPLDSTPLHNDLQTLLCLKLHLSDPAGLLASWKNDSFQYCTWAGVSCSKRHTSRVVALNLESFELNGQIPPCIANLTFLERIHFANNQLGGPIPPELGQLNRLQYLNLSSNNLTGVIPNTLPACSRLQIIDLGTNALQEYGFGSKLSTKGDVYSYGIIILEMLTGRRPTDEMFTNGLNLHKYVEKAFPQEIGEVLDPCIVPSSEDGDVDNNLDNENHATAGVTNCIMHLVKLGLSCSMETPKDRPTMQDVYAEVITIKEAFAALRG